MSLIDKLFSKPKKLKGPYQKYYTKDKWDLKIPEGSIYDYLLDSSKEFDENLIVLSYYGTSYSYKDFIKKIDEAAKAFRSQGIRVGDVVTICMPNTPEAIICVYALNKIGAIASMIHPLSGANEIKDSILNTGSVMLIMIDLVYEKIKNILAKTAIYKTIVISAKDSMPFLMSFAYQVTKGVNVKKPKRSESFLYWKDFIAKAKRYDGDIKISHDEEATAIILASGGTTGTPKSILLTNRNVNAETAQIKTMISLPPGNSILTIMPVFHGFGLVVSIFTPLCMGVEIKLLPTFDAKEFYKIILKNKPNFVVGVPTLYEAFLNQADKLKGEDLSFIKYCVVGGDTLPIPLQRKVEVFLKDHNSEAEFIIGYGMTESVAASIATFGLEDKEGSIGVPLPGMHAKVVLPGTQDELEYNEVGELCITGPTVMSGYLNEEKETNEVLQLHSDGHIWLHTGDLVTMDKDGVVFYKQRLKRMIVSSGYNVFPQQIEKVIESHEAVLQCTVIGIDHPYKVQVAKAYVVLKSDYKASSKIKKSIKEHCQKNLSSYSIPSEFEFRQSLPKTLLGKVNYRKLEEENKK